MITIRYAAFCFAALCLWLLSQTPNSPATLWLAGLFIASFAVVAWTCRQTRRRP